MIRIYKFQHEFFLIMSAFSVICLSCKTDQLLDIEEQKRSLAAPDSLNIFSLSEDSLKLTWRDNSTSELQFILERGEGRTPQSYKQIATVAANLTEFNDADLDKSRTYSYRVKAIREFLESEYSPQISVEISDGILLKSFIGHNGFVNAIAISPDGQMLATGSSDKKVILWNVATGNQLRQLVGHSDRVISLDFSSNGTMLASGSEDNYVILWNTLTGATVRKIYQYAAPNSIVFSPNNQSIAAGLSNYYLSIWNVSSGALIVNLSTGYTGFPGISSIDFSPNGTRIVGFYGRSEIRMWDVNSSSGLWVVQITPVYAGFVCFRPDGNSFASSAYTLDLRRTSNGSVIRQFENTGGYPVCFSMDGQKLVSGGNEVKIWEVSTGKLLYSIETYSGPVVFTNSNDQIIAPMNDDFISSSYGANLWKLASKWAVVP